MSLTSALLPTAHAISVFNLPSKKVSDFKDISDVFNFGLDILLSLAYPLAFAALLYTVYILISSAGKPDAYTKAKENMIYVTTGLFLIIFAVVFVRFVIGLFT